MVYKAKKSLGLKSSTAFRYPNPGIFNALTLAGVEFKLTNSMVTGRLCSYFLFCKSVDSHQLKSSTSHTKNVKWSIIHSQTLGLQRNVSEEKDFIKTLDQLRV